ncbi:EAL and HDOD domain-containing protein [Chitinilyticum litopenaei]|uniref:EAL and HDOD domain-containing protein n=1 Tax=Chitinilyticum litopenaei TaxID=1121276 RepID=UPI00068657C8|nr:HDOD domain-containing protein [Chitinilyticum litopenaei]
MGWLRKLFGGQEETTSPAPSTLSVSAAALAESQAAAGLLRRYPVYDRHWKTVAYAISLRQLPHANDTRSHGQRDAEILLHELGRVFSGQPIRHAIWLELDWEGLPLLLAQGLAGAGQLQLILHGQPQQELATCRGMLAELARQGIVCGVEARDAQALPPALLEPMQLLALAVSSPDLAVLSQHIEYGRQLKPGIALWMHGLDSREAAEVCRQLGVDYLSGRVFTNPDALQVQLPAEFIKLNRVLQMVRRGAEFAEVAHELKSDPVLSVRLLRYVNSAALGLSQTVSSLEQALVVLGQQRVYRWLSLLLFVGGSHSPLDDTLLEAALTRARLMETAAASHFTPAQCEELFLTGLFSLLDYLLRVPRRLLLQELCAPALVVETLAGQPTPYSPWLALAEAGEMNADLSPELLAACGLDAESFGRLQMAATLWALSTLAE